MLDFGFYNMDCMQGMKEFPDKYFDLAIVDPPYGIKLSNNMGRRKTDRKSDYKKITWDDRPPEKEYFEELFRVSKKAIIWGGNYFELPPTKCFLVWRKDGMTEEMSFSMAEYAWTNCEGTSKVWEGVANRPGKIHPTQKPVALYEWLLNRYAKDGDIILDTHVGSASSLIACRNTNHKYVGFEIDEEYYRQAKKRLDQASAQMNIFDLLEEQHESQI